MTRASESWTNLPVDWTIFSDQLAGVGAFGTSISGPTTYKTEEGSPVILRLYRNVVWFGSPTCVACINTTSIQTLESSVHELD